MFVKKLILKDFYMFRDGEISLRHPEEHGHKNGHNIINILIGANGTGKTKLLEYIFSYTTFNQLFKNAEKSHIEVMSGENKSITDRQGLYQEFSERLIHNQEAISGLSEKIYFVRSRLLYNRNNNTNTPNEIVNKRIITIDENFICCSSELISNAVVEKEREINEANAVLRKQQAIDWFNEHFIDSKVNSKLLEIEGITRTPVFTGLSTKSKLRLNDLSSGEQQLYYKVASLILIEPTDSLILIDEPELSLHPEWQATFISTLKKIGSNNQFIIATHSPYIVSNLTPEDNLIVLNLDEKEHNTGISYNPKFIERDINTTIDIMGYTYQLPPHVSELRAKYRKYFEKQEENTEECLKIKNELLQYETLESSFFQEIEFLRALRK